jgi:hypothetical protein
MKAMLISILFSALLTTHQCFAIETLKQGDSLPTLPLTDQHDKPAHIDANISRIIFAADNTGASMVTALLDSKEANWLVNNRSVYLADIHKMPSLISRMFALPQLREKPYTIILGREEADLAMFSRQKGCVAIIPVNALKLGETIFACTEEALKEATK